MHAPGIRRTFLILAFLLGVQQHGVATVIEDAFRTHYGETGIDMVGFSVANLGDLNNDGFEDYAIGTPGWNWVAGRAAIVSGSTGNTMFYVTGSGMASLTGFAIANAGDVNNDGVDDIIVSAPTKMSSDELPLGAVYVRSGVNGAPIHFISGFEPNAGFGWTVAGAGDVDNDGYADFAVGTPFVGSGVVEVFSGLSGSPIRQITAGSGNAQFGRALANIGDVNSDGFDELLIGTGNSSNVYIYDVRNATIMTTLPGVTGSAFGRAVACVGDINSDGVNDFIVGAPNAKLNGVVVGRAFVFSGATTLILKQFHGQPASGFGRSVASVSDFDGDGVRDYIVGSAHLGLTRVDVFSGASSSRIWTCSASGNTELGYSVGGLQDVNGDGYGEVMIGHPAITNSGGSGALYLFSGGVPEPFQLASSYHYQVYGNTPISMLAHNMNGDGDVDILCLANNRLSYYENAGNGTFTTPKLYTLTNATGMAVADIDGDGDSDVIVVSMGIMPVKFYQNTGNKFVFSGALNTSMLALAVVAEDFNNDGRVDLAVSDFTSNVVRVWLGKQSYSSNFAERFKFSANYPVGTCPIQIEAVHVNNDGKYDLAVLNKDSATVSILSNQGGGKFAPRPDVALEGAPTMMKFADLNGDGKQDLVTTITGTGQLSIRSGLPNFLFGSPQFLDVGAMPRGFMIADINNDQLLDVVTVNWVQDAVTVHLNDGGQFSPVASRAVGTDPIRIAVADFDGDGDIDLATLNKAGKSFSIVPNESLE